MYVCSRLGVGEVRHSSPMQATCGRREKMRLITAVLATAATVALPVGLWAQDVFPDVEYIQGRTGFPEKIKGKLSIQETGLTFSTKHDSTVDRKSTRLNSSHSQISYA